MIDLAAEELEIVTRLLSEYAPDCEVRVFGSRINGSTKPYSDLDLVIISEDKIDNQQLSDLREAFVESDLPFRVDLLNWARISPEFRAVIEKKYEVIQA
jgi:predicted nucleotidyltransferase